MKAEDIQRLGNALIGKLQDLNIRAKTSIASKAGIQVGETPSQQQNIGVDSSIRRGFSELTDEGKLAALPILAEQIMSRREDYREEVTALLAHHGYQFIEQRFVPVGLFDEREARHLPAAAASELARAASRLSEPEGESGAITSACGAVDLVTSAAYEQYGLGKIPNSFQGRVNTVMQRLQVFEEIERELIAVDVRPEDAKKIADDMRQSIKYAATALEVIRRTQSDAHGTKPVYRRLAYDALKWASAICGLLEGKV